MPIITPFDGTSAVLRTNTTISQVKRFKEQKELFRTAKSEVRPIRPAPILNRSSRTFAPPEEIFHSGPNLLRLLSGQLASWQLLGLKFNSLLVRVSSLLRKGAFANTLASSTRPDLVEAIGGGIRDDEGGRFRVEVSQLAGAQKISSDKFPSPNSPLGLKGSILINGVEVTVNPSDSLADIKFSINQVLAITVFSSDTDLLQASASPRAAETTHRVTISQLATANGPAIFSVDGVKFVNDTNEVEEVIPGVRLILRETTKEGERIDLTIRNVKKEGGVKATIQDKRLVLTSNLTGADGISVSDREGVLEKLGFTQSTHLASSHVRHDGEGSGEVALSGVASEVGDFVVRVKSGGNPVLLEVSRDGGVNFSSSQNLSSNATIEVGNGVSLTFLDPSSLKAGDEFKFSTFIVDQKFKNEIDQARNAKFTIEGKSFERPTNIIEDALDGITLILKGTTRRPVTLDVKQDVSRPRELIQDFVESFNSLMISLNRQGALGGSLEGDRALGRVRSQLEASTSRPLEDVASEAVESKNGGGRALLHRLRSQMVEDMAQEVDGIATLINSLDKIGIVQEEAGTLVIDEEVLSVALSSNPGGVSELFTRDRENRLKREFLAGSPTSPGARAEAQAGQGIAVRLAERITAITESRVGTIAFRTGIINRSLLNNQDILTERGRAIEAQLEERQRNLGSQLITLRGLSSGAQDHRASLLASG